MAREADRRARDAFQSLALALSRPGERIFDFGAGTGIDARCYAGHGRRVVAYDVDANMCDYFRIHCRDLIESEAVSIRCCGYPEFLHTPEPELEGRMNLITSNFAPLNLIEDLGPLFARFHALTSEHGRVLVAVLSPYFIGDAKYAWWWRNLGRLWRAGHYAVAGAQGPIVRRRLAQMARGARPYFMLERVYRGLPEGTQGLMPASHPRAWLDLTTCRFMFLLFRREPG